MRCERCGEREASRMIAYARDCGDGTQEEFSAHLCAACGGAFDRRTPAERMARRRAGYDKLFAEMRFTLEQTSRVGSEQALAETRERAGEWLAGVVKNNPGIVIPEDLRPLIERSAETAR